MRGSDWVLAKIHEKSPVHFQKDPAGQLTDFWKEFHLKYLVDYPCKRSTKFCWNIHELQLNDLIHRHYEM